MSERIQIPRSVEMAAGVAGGLAIVEVFGAQPLGATMPEGNQDGGYPGEHGTTTTTLAPETTTTTEAPATTTTTVGESVIGEGKVLYPLPEGPTVTTTPEKPIKPAAPGNPNTLPFTGGDILGLGAIGVTTLAVGGLMARARARGRQA